MGEGIGGHRAPDGSKGVEVVRQGNGLIFKEAYTPADTEGLGNEKRMLIALAGDHSPFFVSEGKLDDGTYWISQQDLGDTEAVTDEEKFRRECVLMLWALRKNRIRHGDLTHKAFPDTGGNVIIRDNVPHAIDFQQSHFFDEDHQDKNPLPDAFHVYKWMTYTGPPGEPPIKAPVIGDSYRVVRRWAAVRGALGANVPGGHNALEGRSLVDLGTHMGDFCGMAAADGMHTIGVDNNTIRDGLSFAREFWPMSKMTWIEEDVVAWPAVGCDVIICFSTWPYVIQQSGLYRARMMLHDCIKLSNAFFFETQLHGDGPGPEFLKTDRDVEVMLGELGGEAEPIITLPTGRPTGRTVWKVTRKVKSMVTERPMAEQMAIARRHAHVDDVRWLTQWAKDAKKGSRVVQLGAGSGTMAVALLEGSRDIKLTSVDTNEENLGWEALALSNMNAPDGFCKSVVNSAVVEGRKKNAKVNLLIVDADHSAKAVEADIKAWLPHMASNAIIFVHDYDPVEGDELYPGVKKGADKALKGWEPGGPFGWSAVFKKSAKAKATKSRSKKSKV